MERLIYLFVYFILNLVDPVSHFLNFCVHADLVINQSVILLAAILDAILN